MPASQEGPILIVDDNRDARESMATLLEGDGFPVATASTADDALRRLREGLAPSLICSRSADVGQRRVRVP